MPDIAQQDIAYQPATKGYSFSTNSAVPSQQETNPKKKNNIFVLLIIELLSLAAVFVVFLLVLNYFQIISIFSFIPKQNTINHQTTQSNGPTYDSKTGFWTIKGTFSQYNNEKIKVKTGLFSSADFVYRIDSLFLNSNLSVNNAQPPDFKGGTLFDLDQKENLGKTVKVEYKTENKVNYINTITLYKSL
jgi:hypothetical protein